MLTMSCRNQVLEANVLLVGNTVLIGLFLMASNTSR